MDLQLTFTVSVPENEFGRMKEVDLKKNGSKIDVVDSNKEEYILLQLRYRMLTCIQRQLTFLLQGLFEVLPQHLLSVFDYQELELLLCGLPTIDIKDWKKNTVRSPPFFPSFRTALYPNRTPFRRFIKVFLLRTTLWCNGGGNWWSRCPTKIEHGYFNTRPGHPAPLSKASKLYKATTERSPLPPMLSSSAFVYLLFVFPCPPPPVAKIHNT
jgi:hypothetical protein